MTSTAALREDVFFYSAGSVADVVWWGAARALFGPANAGTFSVSGTYVPTAGDFDGDLRGDIVWLAAG